MDRKWVVDIDPRKISLTSRERVILDEVALGNSNGEIAYKLNIPEQTLKNNITTIFRKFDGLTRIQVAFWWAEIGHRYYSERDTSLYMTPVVWSLSHSCRWSRVHLINMNTENWHTLCGIPVPGEEGPDRIVGAQAYECADKCLECIRCS